MSKVLADQVVLRVAAPDFLRRRIFDKRTYHAFTRADGSTCATYADRNGVLHLTPAARLRVDWDANGPGLLFEGPRTNIVENGNAEVDAVGWVANLATVVRDTTQFALGGASVKVTTQNSTSSGTFIRKRDGTRHAVTSTSNRLHTFHVRVYAPAGSVGKTVKVRIEWWSSAPAFISASEVSGLVLVAGWQWLRVTGAAATSAVTADLFVGGDNAQGVWDFWADLAHFEVGAFGSSSIPTGTGAVSRAFDMLDVRMSLDMERDWSLLLSMQHFASNVASWPDTEPENDCRILSMHPTTDASDGDLGGGFFLQRQNGATQYDYRYFNITGAVSRTFSTTPNAQKLVLRHHAVDHHLSIAIDSGAFLDASAPVGVNILPIRLLRLGTSAYARIYEALLAYELHTQAELEAAA